MNREHTWYNVLGVYPVRANSALRLIVQCWKLRPNTRAFSRFSRVTSKLTNLLFPHINSYMIAKPLPKSFTEKLIPHPQYLIAPPYGIFASPICELEPPFYLWISIQLFNCFSLQTTFPRDLNNLPPTPNVAEGNPRLKSSKFVQL